MTQYHEIDFTDPAGPGSAGSASSFIRIELHEGETPISGTPFLIHVFSPAPYTIFLSCLGTTKRTAVQHPVPGTGRASYVFSDSESVSNFPDTLEGEQIGNPKHTILGDPAFDGESLDIPAESPAAIYDYSTVTFADLVEVTLDETVTALIITGENEDGAQTSLSVTFPPVVTDPEDPGENVCDNFELEVTSTEIIPGGTVEFRTKGPVPVSITTFGYYSEGSTDTEATKLRTIQTEVEERVLMKGGWGTVVEPIWDIRTANEIDYQSRGGSSVFDTVYNAKGGARAEIPIGEFPTASATKLVSDLGNLTVLGTPVKSTHLPNGRKIFIQRLFDLGIKADGMPVDIRYKYDETLWEIVVPSTWYSQKLPLAVNFETCPAIGELDLLDIVDSFGANITIEIEGAVPGEEVDIQLIPLGQWVEKTSPLFWEPWASTGSVVWSGTQWDSVYDPVGPPIGWKDPLWLEAVGTWNVSYRPTKVRLTYEAEKQATNFSIEDSWSSFSNVDESPYSSVAVVDIIYSEPGNLERLQLYFTLFDLPASITKIEFWEPA